jgi:hypothetical protein
MIRIIAVGDGKYQLFDEGENSIGWIRNRTIGFRGFESESAARDAAIAAWRKLDIILGREFPGWPRRDLRAERIETTHDGIYEWFYEDHVPIARLLRPQWRAFDTSFGIELVLPSFANEGVVVTAAHALSAAVRAPRNSPAGQNARAMALAGPEPAA